MNCAFLWIPPIVNIARNCHSAASAQPHTRLEPGIGLAMSQMTAPGTGSCTCAAPKPNLSPKVIRCERASTFPSRCAAAGPGRERRAMKRQGRPFLAISFAMDALARHSNRGSAESGIARSS